MRRRDREVTDEKLVLEIIETCKVCRLAMVDEEGVYIVPMNFGYFFENGELVFYFHSAKEGRKLDAIKTNPSVGFEMDCGHELLKDEKACEYSYYYQSIIGKGHASIVEDVQEKTEAFALIMEHQAGKRFEFDEKMANAVAIIKVRVEEFAAKANRK